MPDTPQPDPTRYAPQYRVFPWLLAGSATIAVFLLFMLYVLGGTRIFGLNLGFLADDLSLVKAGEHMVTQDFLRPFSGPWLWPEIAPNWPAYNYYRPLTILSFGLDWLLWGYEPWGFHLTNCLLHLVCVVLFYLLARRLLPHATTSMYAAVTVLFALHPSHEYNVYWLAARGDTVCMVFSLATLIVFADALRKPVISIPILMLMGVFTFCAIAAKEMAYSLPLVAVAVYGVTPDRPPLRQAPLLLSPIFAVAGLLFATRAAMFGLDGMLPGGGGSGTVVALWNTVRHLILPFHLSFKEIVSENTLMSAAIATALVGVLLPLWRAFFSRPVLLGILWVELTWLPVSSLFMPWYLYVPSAGFCLALGYVLGSHRGWRGMLGGAVVVLLSMAYLAQWTHRAAAWQEADRVGRWITLHHARMGAPAALFLVVPASVDAVPLFAHNMPARLAVENGVPEQDIVISAYADLPHAHAMCDIDVERLDEDSWTIHLGDTGAYFVFPHGAPGEKLAWGQAEVMGHNTQGMPNRLNVNVKPEVLSSVDKVLFFTWYAELVLAP